MTEATRHRWAADVAAGLGVYVLTTLPVALGLALALTPGVMERRAPQTFPACCCHFDGTYYADIITDGYEYDPDRASTVAFFPGYPLAARGVGWLLGLDAKLALVVTANLALAAALVVLSAYLRTRFPDEPNTRLATLALVGIWPVGFFFRMGYSESVFLLALALVLLGLTRRWPVVVLALVAGLATGIRPVGVAATAAVGVAVLLDATRGPLVRRLAVAVGVGLVSCWGLFAYAGYLQHQFGDWSVFVRTQEHWSRYRPPAAGIPTKFLRLALAEPVWNCYNPASPRFWSRSEEHGVPVLGLQFWNPILFALAAAAVVFGWRRGWLTRPEAVLGFGLVLIPYVTRADELSMGSHARFAAVVLPAFVVLGRALSRCPPPVAWAVFALLAPLLAVWTAMFAAWWPMV